MNRTAWDRFERIVAEGAESLGVALSSQAVLDIRWLSERLVEWNTRMNLTAVVSPEGIAVKHVLDSLSCLGACRFPQGASFIDVGAGAGFPGLVLKAARPDIRLTLLDSTKKKLAYAADVAEGLGWADMELLAARAEEAGRDPAWRERYDIVAARAVAAMRILSEFCLPFAKPGGVFLAMKGPDVCVEMSHASSAIGVLGGDVAEHRRYSLPYDGGERSIIVIRKSRPTPAQYPRLFRDIKRKPIDGNET
ncbi:MAG: 16S rRNA (guanine(527)-N(7))-methyltransferase RsmG [Armatimonadetes bacterium]|jgi:16S rRNA (guanine527-N7)-methyltransferase|nr:16S rRNA (guanine(527)-N(7))-methyltransferase RsmG [Armatimonadota bacterium]HOC31675.1 16S rRNA (guanine(527)-N(7))-methyltransferase RsmG [Armatimonadota bacterium]